MTKLDVTHVENLHRTMDGYVERGGVAGIVTLIARGEELHVHATGKKVIDGTQAMEADTIFRIASITKPITAAAAMILVDDGKLQLDTAVDRWLPELANRKVLKNIASELDDTVPAHRPITVRDLLTSTFGFGSVMTMPDTYPIQRPIREGNLGGDGFPHYAAWPAPDEWMRRLGALPLMHQPGERWLYNTSYDVLGVLVARVSGQTFGSFLQERLFGPLGMIDTGFSVPPAKQRRLPALYQRNAETHALDVFDGDGAASEYSGPIAFESGSGGLLTTAKDYHAFCRMLLNAGRCGRQRILQASSVETMTSNQVSAAQQIGADIFFGGDSGWGFGMAVATLHDEPWNVPGRFGWDGGFGTSAYSDPTNDFIGILLTQLLVDSPEATALSRDFWTRAYQTLA